ncbi:MAG: conjugal transfer protein TraN [Bacillota bacterium]|nr:conjugal transfer protein TraN [Bacillota bacterium]
MNIWKKELLFLTIHLAITYALFFLFLFFFSLPVQANSWKNLQRGDQTAQEFLNQMNQKQQEGGVHPFYQGISKEAHYKDTELKGRGQAVCAQDPASQMIYESSGKRPQMKIDPQKDPLIAGSQKAMDNPLEIIGGQGTQVVEVQQGGKTETINCEEAGEDSLETCASELTVKVIKIKVIKEKVSTIRLTGCKKSYKDWHLKSCEALRGKLMAWRKGTYKDPAKKKYAAKVPIPVSFPLDVTDAFKTCLQETLAKKPNRCYRCNNPRNNVPQDIDLSQIQQVLIEKHPSGKPQISGKAKVCSHGNLKGYDLSANIKIIYEEESHEVLPDEWSDDCARLEERVDSGLCGYYSRVCTQGPATRVINGVPITRDCWQMTMTYACSFPAKDDCGPLRARGCAQIHSQCKQYVGNACVVYGQTYQCQESHKTTFQIQGGNIPFCMDGNCRDQSWDNNDEMMSSVAQLSILKEMQGNFKKGFLFKGEDNRCSKYVLDFKDCCGSGSGWGKDIGLGGCKSKEKLLNKRRKAGLCHRIGTYCDKKILGQCVKKKTTFCCFGSKLLKADPATI